ncbi:hypothetical protein TorRG33x02_195440 [Trema orientale]|uniref:Uncharacterized protein n=1 Tax=Trema orientale TaxID=63057 RepID=A0A2P5EGN3_TREOI|nr:hypothetical protein TorRG33x02_195440 [Trema orientale]
METTDETFAASQLWSSSPQGAYFVAKRTISKSHSTPKVEIRILIIVMRIQRGQRLS